MRIWLHRRWSKIARVDMLPWLLLGLAVVSYGLLIPWLGFFWDDFPVAWIADRLGQAGLERYFANNRPWLSWLYRLSVGIFGVENPWRWHVFALFTRFLAGLAFWGLVRKTWQKDARLAIWAGLFFMVYPGFKQQWVSIIYSHFFLILSGLLFSFLLSVHLVVQRSLAPPPNPLQNWRAWASSAVAWLLAGQNLLFMDYFFFLELARPIFLWEALDGSLTDRKLRFKKVLREWLPFLILWGGFVLWRFLTLKSQAHHYQVTFFDQLGEAPGQAMLTLAQNILYSLWISIPVAWANVFRLPGEALGNRMTLIAFLFTGTVLGMLAVYLLQVKRTLQQGLSSRGGALGMISTGLLTCLAGGWSVWLAGLWIDTGFAADRLSLVFMPGSALILAGALGLLPAQRPVPWLLAALFTSLAAGQQFVAANTFRQEWELQQRFFWQLSWRAPDLKAGTMILADELPFTYFTDNSLTAPVNWHYAPENQTEQMSFLLFYPARRLGTSLPGLEPGLSVSVDYLAAAFQGNTSQVLSLVFKPPACLRILDPELDVENKMLSTVMEHAATLSSTGWILSEQGGPPALPNMLSGQEPVHAWCYYFEKADLARQQGDWEQVAALGDQAFAVGDYPNDPLERLPFIEGYAHLANWSRALELSTEAQRITPMMAPVLCRLWERIDSSTPASMEKEETLPLAVGDLNCELK